ncbi:MAG TPA: hypothetical protein VMC06_07860, partial [Opitutaceae bacterium]|nr:hypothetical protein [Opitutaceae bacterium]
MKLSIFKGLSAIGVSLAIASWPLSPGATAAVEAEARLFTPGIGATADAGGITFTPDGQTAYFGAKGPSGIWAIHESRLVNGQWNTPVVAPFSGRYVEGDPQMSPDGARLFFFSRRPAAGKPKDGWWPDLWYVERQGDGWSEPRLVGAGENGAWNPLTLRTGTPSPAADGTLYFFRCLDPVGQRVRIVRSKPVGGRYRDFEDLGDRINGQDDGFDLVVASDQSFIVFSCAKRADSHGGMDLYISYREG